MVATLDIASLTPGAPLLFAHLAKTLQVVCVLLRSFVFSHRFKWLLSESTLSGG
jgi:hypothetical protein